MSLLAIDPNGDLEIILTHPQSGIRQFTDNGDVDGAPGSHPLDDRALKPRGLTKKEKVKKKRRDRLRSQWAEDPPPAPPVDEAPSVEEPTEEEPIVDEDPNDGNDLEINGDKHIACDSTAPSEHSGSGGLRLLVSSKHLCLASSTFRLMLSGPWLEGSKTETGNRTVQASDCDAEALVIVLDIMHGKHFAMPQTVDLELLANIACVVDYYDCHEVVEPFVDQWIKALEPKPPTAYGRQCMLWMSISWVFLRETALISMAQLAVIGCRGHIDDMGLPLPDVLLRRIEEKRIEMIEGLLLDLNRLWSSLTKEESCRPGCSYMLLGALTSHMKKAGVFSPLQQPEPYGDSIEWLHTRILSFDSPTFRETSHSPFHSHADCSCRLKTRITPLIDLNRGLLKKLVLENIYRGRLQQREEARQTALALRFSWLPSTAPHPVPGDHEGGSTTSLIRSWTTTQGQPLMDFSD
ncbi:uncharacterized protein B0I36DRAFT_412376 [Microdochium trichocladiopsis]|uniref:BTB domain-containing protein n=1 Tax=Microdochium trichocladiopsis TaxID=1682393 RepID=A0A9P9BMS1_9PEZI|nr:uncharacterized protein B0I36DRAFT_412376 [Microdochium trichocladiopsis]KAH7029903.1 hypothetical protein B0I36DRAFT_412376 [Microdochium trichocladiopsis]